MEDLIELGNDTHQTRTIDISFTNVLYTSYLNIPVYYLICLMEKM